MWVEAIFAKDDLEKVVMEFCPLRIALRQDGNVLISGPRDIELVPDAGLRMSVTVEVHWPLFGVYVPISARKVTLELRPEIKKNVEGDQLTFKFRLDGLDISIFPALVDRGIVAFINDELEAKHVELSWGFTQTLSHVFDLPPALQSARAIDLRAAWGEVRITNRALVLAVSFHAAVTTEERKPSAPTAALAQSAGGAPSTPGVETSRAISWPGSWTTVAWVAGAATLGAFWGDGFGTIATPTKKRLPPLSEGARVRMSFFKRLFDLLKEAGTRWSDDLASVSAPHFPFTRSSRSSRSPSSA
jgi:hypothetical protein